MTLVSDVSIVSIVSDVSDVSVLEKPTCKWTLFGGQVMPLRSGFVVRPHAKGHETRVRRATQSPRLRL